MDDLIEQMMSGEPSADGPNRSAQGGSPQEEPERRSKVERDWRNEEEPPEEEEPDDGDPQDGDPQDGEGEQQEGDPQEGEGDPQEGEGDPQEGEAEGESSEGEQQEGEGDPSDGDSSEGQSSEGQPSEGQPQSGQGKQSGSANPSGQDISDEQAEALRKNRDLSLSEEDASEESNSKENASGEDGSGEKSEDQKRREEQAQALNDQAFGDEDTSGWEEAQRQASGERVTTGVNEGDDGEFFTDTGYTRRADKIEDKIQDFAYQINENDVGTDWTPQQIEDHKLATQFALLVAKVAEDMSYTEVDGDRFWDTHEIMKRQVTKKPLHQCRHDYEKSRLALLVDTSPSCADEAIFYSKIASGAMLRDDIDIFLCPNGHIDAKFDRDVMRFVTDNRKSEWDLEGRVVLYFTDWDGNQEIIDNSKNSKIYWFDNTTDMWDDDNPRSKKARYQFEGEHFEVPDQKTFKRVSRKIRP
jgi:hypothetical protein